MYSDQLGRSIPEQWPHPPDRRSVPEYHLPSPPSPSHATPRPASRTAQPLPSFVTPAIDNRTRAIGFAVLGIAGVVLLATVTKSWFIAGPRGGLGLLGLESCRLGSCQSVSWLDIPGVPPQFKLFAVTALLASFATVAMLVHTAIMLLHGTPERVRTRWLGHSVAFAMVGTLGFVGWLAFGDWTRGITLGWSTATGLAGLFAAGITAAFVVRSSARPL
jgi:hypothetical protein